MDNVNNIEVNDFAPVSEISWGAIIAGALVAVVTSLGFVILGSGLGLSLTPWFSTPVSAKVTAEVIIWLIITQWAAAAFGGYLTGRLRLRWPQLHRGEVFFRDTAHGFLAWIVSTLFAAGFVAVAVPAIAHGGMHAAKESVALHTSAPSHPGEVAGALDPFAYYVDSLYRSAGPAAPATGTVPANDIHEIKAETNRIIVTDVKNDLFPDADKAYLGQLVSTQTGLSQADATTRVNNILAQINSDKEKAKSAANEARKAAATFSFASFLSMLVGAFIASVAAVMGGRRRDRHQF